MQFYAEGLISGFLQIRHKRRLILAVLLLMSISSGVAYSIWNLKQAEVTDPVIEIGVGTVLTVSDTVQPEPGTTIVPYGAFRGDRDVDEYVFTYQVRLNKPGKLVVDLLSVMIGGLPDVSGIIDVSLYGGSPAESNNTTYVVVFDADEGGGYVATVNVRIRLSAGAADESYLAIQGQPIALTIRFTAESLVA